MKFRLWMYVIRLARRSTVLGSTAPVLLLLTALAGCISVPADRLSADRLDYGQVLADSWKRQTLLNVVRLRYADAPVFLEVASIINTYSVAGKGTLGRVQQTSPGFDSVTLGLEGTWSNTPTITYQPVLGDRFTKSLLQPVPPVAIFQLLQGGWGADLVMRTVVSSMNGLRNASGGLNADPRFDEVVRALAEIQQAGGLSIRVEPRKDGTGVMLVVPRGEISTRLREVGARLREALGIEKEATEFEIAYGLLPRAQNEIAILSRSMLELMLQLGLGIELPMEHQAQGLAMRSRGTEAEALATALVRIKSGKEAPQQSFVAVPYRGHWYWIDDNDIESKKIFTFLLILFSLAETGQSAAAPIVTVPSR